MSDRVMRYSMLIRWSEEDRLYLVALPEWDGHILNWRSATHGETYEAAAANGHEVLQMLVEDVEEAGEPLPDPQVFVASDVAAQPVPA